MPELAAREHLNHLLIVIEDALKKASCTKDDIELIAVTSSPGLMGALLMGVNCAKALGFCLNVPVIGVNHIQAHLFANFIDHGDDITFPALGLVVSGGHTALLYMEDKSSYTIVGSTLDDAIGECFDKVARMLDLPYPGGPEIEKLAKEGDPSAYEFKVPSVKGSPYSFSFSGLKTKILYTLYGQNGTKGEPILPKEEYKHIAAAFQKSAFKSLVNAINKASKEFPVKSLLVGGGVSCSDALKKMFESRLSPSITPFFPRKSLTLDNAAMIAALGYHNFQETGPSEKDFSASPTSKTTSFSFCN